MRKFLFIKILFMVVISIIVAISLSDAQNYTITQLTDNSSCDFIIGGRGMARQINANGYVVWDRYDSTDREIFFYDGNTITQLTHNSYTDRNPQINDNGYVVWKGGNGIFFYDRNSTTQLADNCPSGFGLVGPQINNNGDVVWLGEANHSQEIFFYDGNTITQLTHNLSSDFPPDWSPQINDNGEIVWHGHGEHSQEIFFYDGNTIIQLTDNSYSDHYPMINNNGYVVWCGHNGNSNEIFLYDGNSITQLTDNSYFDFHPSINNNGYVVWTGHDGRGKIFLYDGKTVTRLTNSDHFDNDGAWINNNGYVVWQGHAGNHYEIFVYDGKTKIITQITDNFYEDGRPRINDKGDIVWHGWDGNDFEIFLGIPAIIAITAAVEGSQTPGVKCPPFTGDPMVKNGGFTITPDSFDPGHTEPLGDGVDEGTSWRFDFTEDPEFQCFPTSLPLASALLTLELTPKDSLISTDAFTIDRLPPIITPTIQNLSVCETCTIQIELTNFYRNRALPDLLKAKHGCIPAFYADDAIVSFAELTLTFFPGEKVNDRFPDLGPDDVRTDFDTTPCAENCVGTFTITAEFKNTSSDALSDLFFEVVDLTGGKVLCNADGGVPWGYGADFTVPMDGVLKPGDTFVVEFKLGLASFDPFAFEVDLFGVVQ